MKRFILLLMMVFTSLNTKLYSQDSNLTFTIKHLSDSVTFVEASNGTSFTDSTGVFEGLMYTDKLSLFQKGRLPYKTEERHGLGFEGIYTYKHYKVNTYLVLTEKGLTFEKMRDNYSDSPVFLWLGVLSIILSLISIFYHHKDRFFILGINIFVCITIFCATLVSIDFGLPWMVICAYGASLVSLCFSVALYNKTGKLHIVFMIIGIILSFIFP